MLFDEIIFADSQPLFIRRELVRDIGDRAEKDIAETEKVYDFLIREGIVKVFDPVGLLKEHDLLLTTSIANDIRDDQFCETAIHYSVDVWNILRERLPPTFLGAFYPGAGTFSEAITLQALIKANGNLNELPPNLREFAEFRWGRLPKDQLWDVFRGRYKFVVGGNPIIKLETYEVPFLQASSLRINEALLLCATQDYVPFTDSAIHDQLMNMKVSRTLRSLAQSPEIRQRLEVDLQLSLPQTHLALSILDRFIPEDDLAKRNIMELVKYRQRHKEYLTRFREKLAELASDIERVEPGPDYDLKIRKLVASKVVPEISKARDELVAKYEETFGTLAKQSVQVIAPTLAATVFSGLGFWEILGACAIAELGMLTVEGAKELIGLWGNRRGVSKRNAFSYVTSL